MSNAVLTAVYGSQPGFPSGSAVAAIAVAAVAKNAANSPPAQTVPAGTLTVVFANLAADDYTFTATPVDASGNPLVAPGYTPPTTTLTIPVAQTVTLSVPTGLSAVVA